jgi:TFIIH basal transcription factor complex TTD-A subunit
MVKATSGTLIECDPTVKELLKSLDEKWHFIIEHLDDTHVFIVSEYLEKVKTELERLLDENSYVITTDEGRR